MERSNAVPVSAAGRTLADHLATLRRRRKPAMICAAAALAIAIAVAFLWPATYRSTATILIEQQEVPVDLVRSTISSYADQRIQVINQRVMTTENLMRIIDRYGLYPEDRRSVPREVLLGRMRDDIKFSMISADVVDPRIGRPTKATIAFSVSFDHRSAQTAAKVANEITSLYLNENLESRRQMADDAATFLTTEGDRLDKLIAGLDAKLATFKEQHGNSLPELTPFNLQLQSRAEEELRETDARIRSLDQQIVYLEAQLAQLEPAADIYTDRGERVLSPSDRLKMLKSEYARANAIYAADHPDVVRMKREIAGLEKETGSIDEGADLARQLRDAQGKLAQAREKYAPNHPDVQQLERLVKSIGQMMSAAPQTSDAVRAQADNPAWIQVSAQREAAVNERTSLVRNRSAVKAKLKDFDARLSQSPDIAREYSGLVRDLENAQLKYRDVRQKQMEATLAKTLESERKGERFTLIEPPLPGEEPVSPNRKIILLLGFILALSLAGGMVALFEAIDPTVRSRRDLGALLPVAPLAVLPWIDTPAEYAARSRTRKLSLAGVAGVLVVAVPLVHFLYRPLDVLWQIALRRLVG